MAILGLIVVLFFAACNGDDDGGPTSTQPPPAVPSFIRLESDAGDYIGAGRWMEYTQAIAVLAVSLSSNIIRISVKGDQRWEGEFAAPSGSPMQVGTYNNATRYPFNGQGPGLSWMGEARGCGSVAGYFILDSLTQVSGVLTGVDLRFEQRCEGGIPALRGTIHWRADDPTRPAGPVLPVPANLWKPDPAFVPASGPFVLLASDPGDWVGQGNFQVFTGPTSPVTLLSSGTKITVYAGGYFGEFVTMLGTVPLTAGYYGNLMRSPFHNPARGGLSWAGNGRGCNTLTGWFAIDRIVYVATTMTEVEMRFEQHCDGLVPALRGAIRWSQ